MEMPMPGTFAVALTLKVGDLFGNSRVSYGAALTMELVVEYGYPGCLARVRRKVDQMKEVVWSDDGSILLKPAISAPQSKFITMAQTDEELAVQLSAAWRPAAKRKTGYDID